MKISLYQMDIAWENPSENREKVLETLREEAAGSDLLVLPEMFLTGFSMRPERIAQPGDEASVRWMAEAAAQSGTAIAGSLAVKEGEGYYNRFFFVEPSG